MGKGLWNDECYLFFFDKIVFTQIDSCKITQVVKSTFKCYLCLFSFTVEIDVEEADLAVVKENIFRCNTFILSLSPAFGGSSVQRDEFSVVGVRLQCSSHSCGFIGSLFPVAYGRHTVFFHKDVGIVALCNDNVVIKRLSV